MKLYGICNKETGLPLGFSTFANSGEFCNDVGAKFTYNPDSDGSSVYMVTSMSTAYRALESDPDWYNSSTVRPQWPDKFNPKNWEVFQVNIPVTGE